MVKRVVSASFWLSILPFVVLLGAVGLTARLVTGFSRSYAAAKYDSDVASCSVSFINSARVLMRSIRFEAATSVALVDAEATAHNCSVAPSSGNTAIATSSSLWDAAVGSYDEYFAFSAVDGQEVLDCAAGALHNSSLVAARACTDAALQQAVDDVSSRCGVLPPSRFSGLLQALREQFGGQLAVMRSSLDARGACLSPATAIGFSDAYRRAGVALAVLCRIIDGQDARFDTSKTSWQLASLLMELSHYTSIVARAVGEQLLRAELPGANGTDLVSPVQQYTTQSVGPLYDSVGTRALVSLATQMPFYAGQLDACFALTQTFRAFSIAAAKNYMLKAAQTRTAGDLQSALNISAAAWMQLTRDTLREHQLAVNALLRQLQADAAGSAQEAVDAIAFAVLLCVVGVVLALGMVLLVRYRLRGHALRVKEAALVASSQFVRFISHEGRNPANSALLAADLLSEELEGDIEAQAAGPDTAASGAAEEALEGLQSKLELVATIKDALQQQIHVFSDALDWEKIMSGSFTLERLPVAIVQEVQALVHMMAPAAIAKDVRLVFRFKAHGAALNAWLDCLPRGQGAAAASGAAPALGMGGRSPASASATASASGVPSPAAPLAGSGAVFGVGADGPHDSSVTATSEADASVGGLPQLLVAAAKYRLRSITTNLVSNAVKFSPPGSRVEICIAVEAIAEEAEAAPAVAPQRSRWATLPLGALSAACSTGCWPQAGRCLGGAPSAASAPLPPAPEAGGSGLSPFNRSLPRTKATALVVPAGAIAAAAPQGSRPALTVAAVAPQRGWGSSAGTDASQAPHLPLLLLPAASPSASGNGVDPAACDDKAAGAGYTAVSVAAAAAGGGCADPAASAATAAPPASWAVHLQQARQARVEVSQGELGGAADTASSLRDGGSAGRRAVMATAATATHSAIAVVAEGPGAAEASGARLGRPSSPRGRTQVLQSARVYATSFTFEDASGATDPPPPASAAAAPASCARPSLVSVLPLSGPGSGWALRVRTEPSAAADAAPPPLSAAALLQADNSFRVLDPSPLAVASVLAGAPADACDLAAYAGPGRAMSLRSSATAGGAVGVVATSAASMGSRGLSSETGALSGAVATAAPFPTSSAAGALVGTDASTSATASDDSQMAAAAAAAQEYASLPAAPSRVRISIAVRDQGVGIGAEDLKGLFQPFVQIKAGQQQKGMGTGLGLAIARRLAQLHDGDITVESEVGRGSTFTFTFVADVVAPSMTPAGGRGVELAGPTPGSSPSALSSSRPGQPVASSSTSFLRLASPSPAGSSHPLLGSSPSTLSVPHPGVPVGALPAVSPLSSPSSAASQALSPSRMALSVLYDESVLSSALPTPRRERLGTHRHRDRDRHRDRAGTSAPPSMLDLDSASGRPSSFGVPGGSDVASSNGSSLALPSPEHPSGSGLLLAAEVAVPAQSLPEAVGVAAGSGLPSSTYPVNTLHIAAPRSAGSASAAASPLPAGSPFALFGASAKRPTAPGPGAATQQRPGADRSYAAAADAAASHAQASAEPAGAHARGAEAQAQPSLAPFVGVDVEGEGSAPLAPYTTAMHPSQQQQPTTVLSRIRAPPRQYHSHAASDHSSGGEGGATCDAADLSPAATATATGTSASAPATRSASQQSRGGGGGVEDRSRRSRAARSTGPDVGTPSYATVSSGGGAGAMVYQVPAGYERFASASKQRKAAAARDAQLLAAEEAPRSAAAGLPVVPVLGARHRLTSQASASSSASSQVGSVGQSPERWTGDAVASGGSSCADDNGAGARGPGERSAHHHTIAWGADSGSALTAASAATAAPASSSSQPHSAASDSPLPRLRLPSTDSHASSGGGFRGRAGSAEEAAGRHAAAPPLHAQEEGGKVSAAAAPAAPRFRASFTRSRSRAPSADALAESLASERAHAAAASPSPFAAHGAQLPGAVQGRDASPDAEGPGVAAHLAAASGLTSAHGTTPQPAVDARASGDLHFGMATITEESTVLPSPLVAATHLGGASGRAGSVEPGSSGASASSSSRVSSDPAACRPTVTPVGRMPTHSASSPAAPLQAAGPASGGVRRVLSPPPPLASPMSAGGWSQLSASPGGSPGRGPSASAGAGLHPAADSRARAFAGLSALIVDDSDTNRLLMARTLRTLGFACDTAENGAAAVARVAAAAASARAPGAAADGGSLPALHAVVLMDKTMPVLGGIDATKQLREAPISYRGLIVGVTGDAGRGDQQDFIRAGADAVLPKPLVKADLIALLHQHLPAATAPGLSPALARA